MSDKSVQLPIGFLRTLVGEFTDSNTVGFLLTGSHARGDADRYSDIDLMKFVRDLPQQPAERYVVRFRDEHLVAISVTTVAEKTEEMRKPEKAIWAVPGIRQASILTDSGGELASLKSAAEGFKWEDLQVTAELYASHELADLSEEVHKVLNAALHEGRADGEYAILGLLLGLTRTVAVKLGLMISTENDYFRIVREAVGLESQWTRNHVALCEGSRVKGRISNALSLYLDTSALIDKVSDAEDAVVINTTSRRIESCLREHKL